MIGDRRSGECGALVAYTVYIEDPPTPPRHRPIKDYSAEYYRYLCEPGLAEALWEMDAGRLPPLVAV